MDEGAQTATRAKRETRKSTLVLAHDLSHSKIRRTKIFIQLWWINMSARHITATNLFFVLPQLPSAILNRINSSRTEPLTSPALPELLSFFELGGISRDVKTLVRAVLHHEIDGQTLRDAVFSQGAAALTASIIVQVLLAFVQTVLELHFHKSDGKQNRALLLKVARGLGVESPAKMNLDQMRVSVAEALVDPRTRRRRNSPKSSSGSSAE